MNDISKTRDGMPRGSARSIQARVGARRRCFQKGGVLQQADVGAVRPSWATAARARAADRISAPDPGPGGLPARGPSAGAGRRAQDPHGGGLRGRDLLRALRRGGGRRGARRQGDGARVRQPELRAGRRRGADRRAAGRQAAGGARRARAVHRLLPYGARGRGGASACRSCHAWQAEGDCAGRTRARGDAGVSGFRRLRESRRHQDAARLPVRRAQGGGRDRGAVRWRPARPRRRGIPRRGASGAWCAPRRGRA